MNRPTRFASVALAGTLTAALAAACGSSSAPSSSPGTSSASSATNATSASTAVSAGSGGLLKVALPAGVMTSLSPQPYGVNSNWFSRAIYDPVVNLSGTTPTPGLATSWTFAPGDSSLTLTLRSGVKFSDGSTLAASDVVWNINWLKQATTGAQAFALWQEVTATAPTPTTVTLAFAHPVPEIFGMLADALIVKPNGQTKGIGTGPFVVKAFTPGTSLTLTRNTAYWQPDEPKLSGIDFTNYPDASSATLALKSGTVNMIVGPQLTAVAGLKSSGFTVTAAPATGNYDLLFNTTSAPLNNSLVREALSLAFNRQQFVQTALMGDGAVSYSIWPPDSPAFTTAGNSGSFDLAKAKQLLTQAGVGPFTLNVETPAFLPQTTFLPIYQQNLATIGVTLNIKTIDPATWASAASTGNFPQALAHIYQFANSDPGLLFIAFPFRPTANAEHFTATTYTQAVAQASTWQAVSARISDYSKIGDYVKQEAFMLPLATYSNFYATASNVSGFVSGADSIPVYSAMAVK